MTLSQSRGGPLVGHFSSRPVSLEMPLARGPRNCGQSSTWPACAVASVNGVMRRITPKRKGQDPKRGPGKATVFTQGLITAWNNLCKAEAFEPEADHVATRAFSKSATRYRLPFLTTRCPSAAKRFLRLGMPPGYFSLSSPPDFNVRQ